MKLFFEFFPFVLFFAAYKFKGIYFATATAIAAIAAQIAWSLLRRRNPPATQWASLAIIAVFGGATLVLRDPTFIKWKPTVLYWLFAVVLFVSATFFDRNLIAAMMRGQLTLPAAVWRNLNLGWASFFGALGGLNLFVAYRFSEGTWVNFKVFGTTGLLLAFALVQGLVLSRYAEEDESGS
jgi:intracellular septation protein